MLTDTERLRIRVSKLEKEMYSLRTTLAAVASALHMPVTTVNEGTAIHRASKLLSAGLAFDSEMLPDND